ncbi:hypothetical protein [Stackebrandtia soli]|uniref:hypothetical protein n=1 Tax=Stackebrandtia soli TaxID=1892856 RepID=UPI0039E93CF0
MTANMLERATTFVYTHARLLERRVAELEFGRKSGARAALAALEALEAYRNADGALGQALEPDVRAPESQPLAIDFGLAVAERLQRHADDAAVSGRIARFTAGFVPFLASVTSEEGGVPIVTPAAADHPRAAHWGDCRFPAGLNPTANIVVRLRALGVHGDWLDRAEAFCVKEIDRLVSTGDFDGHALENLLRFLGAARDRKWADAHRATIAARIQDLRFFNLYPSADYGVSPLDIAPDPDDPTRELFPSDAIAAHLDALAAGQSDDGGWRLTWEPPAGAATAEWRGVVTVNAISVLRRNGR